MSAEEIAPDSASPRTWKQIWLPRLVALAISSSVALFVCEIAVRALHGAPLPSRAPLSRVEANAARGWQMVPGEEHYTYQHRVHINRFGLRGEDLDELKPPGEQRILALGDSTTYGQGVSDQTTLPAQLESQLEQLSGNTWRVINSGHRAYGTNQELALLRELGPALDPDVVILFWYNNDFEEYNIDKVHAEFVESGRRTFDIGTQFTGTARLAWQAKQLVRHSALVMYLHDIVVASGKQPLSPEYEAGRLKHFGAELDDFKALCAEHGWRPVFAVIPHASSLQPAGANAGPARRAASVKQAARDRGLLVLEMEEPLKALTREMGRPPTIPYDGHYLGIAHRRMAEAIAPQLLQP